MMNKLVFIVFLVVIPFLGFSQSKRLFKKEICAYQEDQNKKFKDERTSPLTQEDLVHFEQLDFYKPRMKYSIQARFIRAKDSKPFEMPTTTERKPIYEKYGDLHFELGGRPYSLTVYQSQESMRNPLYRNKVFLPFKDLTCGKGSYGGGRFIYMDTPKGESAILDFNKAFNPLCAYNHKYSCPIVPKENYLSVAIPAGVKQYH